MEKETEELLVNSEKKSKGNIGEIVQLDLKPFGASINKVMWYWFLRKQTLADN